jgi:hypothetical protein
MRLCFHHRFYARKFAGPLKGMVYSLLDRLLPIGVNAGDFVDGDKKEAPIPELGGITARRLMQTLGTEWGRGLDRDFWVRTMEAELRRFSHSAVVVDDMRFDNEWVSMKNLGATLVRIRRPGEYTTSPSHISEGRLDSHPFDVTIDNDGTVEDLYAQIDKLVNK